MKKHVEIEVNSKSGIFLETKNQNNNKKKKLLDTTKRPNSRPGQGKATLRGQTIFFPNIDFFPLISNIKSFTGTKYIWTTSCRNWKACVCLFFSFSNPTQFQKNWFSLNRRTTVCIIQITSRCTHFGFHQDKIKHLLNYWWNMNKVLPIIRQENNTRCFFFPSSSSLLLDQDNIYRDAKLPHCQKKKKKNSTSEYENNTRKWLLRAWWDLWWKPLKWVKFLLGPLWTVHCAFFLFIHSNTSPYNTSPHICNHFSVWHTILSF